MTWLDQQRWSDHAAVAAFRALPPVVFCACSRLVAADAWTVSGLIGVGNHVTRVGVEAQIPSSYAGLLGENWSWSLSWAGDVSYWRAEGHVDSNRSLWEGGFTPIVTLGGGSISAIASNTVSVSAFNTSRMVASRNPTTASLSARFACRICGTEVRAVSRGASERTPVIDHSRDTSPYHGMRGHSGSRDIAFCPQFWP